VTTLARERLQTCSACEGEFVSVFEFVFEGGSRERVAASGDDELAG